MAKRPSFSYFFAQATVEYIIIIALILVLAIIILSVSGFFPSFAYSAQTTDSAKYWAESAYPIAIIDYMQENDKLSLILENRASANIDISEFEVTNAGLAYSRSSIDSIPPGGRSSVILTTISCSGSKTLEYGVEIEYNTDSVSGLEQNGIKPLYIRCKD